MVIHRIGVGSLARLAAFLYGSIGLIVGICVFLVSLLGLGMPSDADSEISRWVAPIFGVGAVVILPLLYATVGALALSVVGLLYNLAARTVGGVQIETDRPL